MRFNSHYFFRNIFLLAALVSSLLLTACGGGGGGGSAPAPATSNVTVTIPGSLLTQPSGNERAATDGSSDYKLKVAAYSEGKKKTDVKIEDRQLTSNGTDYTANVEGLLNAYDYRFIAYYKNTEILSNQISSSELTNGANITLNIDTSYKTLAYDAWLKKSPSNASMKNFKDNSKTAGFSKDADFSKLSLQIGNDSFTVNQYKANLLTVAKGESATIPTSSNSKINIDKISAADNSKTSLYTIVYNLSGGTIAKANPAQYGIASETITLNNPTKAGYNFKGWTGSNGNTPQTTVTIQKGSKENKNYTANWSLISYSITCNLDGGIFAKANPTQYDITSATITLNNPTKDGFNFKGWTGSNGNTPQTTVTIAKGSTGNKEFTANWAKKNILEGSGTADDPFIVATADDLNKLRLINDGSYFKQTKDIDLSSYGSSYDNGSGWLPIPYTDSNNTNIAWNGNYDGNNHKITNLSTERFISGVGLFGRLATDSVISNLNIETSSDGLKGINTIGILAGVSYSKKITNCSVKGRIIGFDNDIGGMVGLSYSQYISDCVGSCTIYVGPSTTVAKPTGKTGGLIGYQLGNSYTISNCKTSTNIESLDELDTVGGMFGCCMGNGLISNCRTTGKVKTTGNVSGGLAGIIDSNVSVKSCVSSTTSMAVGLMAGGFVGINRGTIELSISEAGAGGKGDIGGFAGTNNGNISKCYSTQVALLYSANDSAIISGGFVGQNYSTVSNCYSLGIVTYSLGDSNKFTAYSGAFAGQNMEGAVIDCCYSVGSSECSFKDCGGIAGSNEGTIRNCIALGSSVRAYQNAGRIAGDNTGSISNCYAVSTMTVGNNVPSSEIGSTKINGQSVTASTYQSRSWWINTLGFDSSIWKYSTTNKRMELNNMPSVQ